MANSIVQSVFTTTMKMMGDASRVIQFTGTLETTDRMGDVIEAKGWELGNYVKNPVYLWDHDPSLPPIGKTLKMEQRGNALIFDVEFAPAEVNPFADRIFRSYKEGFLSAVSVGFIPKEVEAIRDAKGVMTGFRIKKQELLELSAVSIPAHQDALAASAFKKSLDEEVRKLKRDEKKSAVQTCSLSDYLDNLSENDPVVQASPEQKSLEEMSKEDMEQLEQFKKELAELKAEVKSLLSLRESVDLSKATMDTLNKSIVALMSKNAPAADLKAMIEQPVDKTTVAPDLDPLKKALEAFMTRINGANQFTPNQENK